MAPTKRPLSKEYVESEDDEDHQDATDDEDDASGDEEETKPVKKQKAEKAKGKPKKNAEADESRSDEKLKKNDEGETYFELSRNRRVTIRKWRSSVLIDIREYYEKGDKSLPGKKGISLSADQFETLKNLIGDISDEVAKAK